MFNTYPRCRSRVYPPSAFEALPRAEQSARVKALAKPPSRALALRHVFGSQSGGGGGGRGCSTLVPVPGAGIAFAASAAVVVWDPATRPSPPQRFFRGHRDEVTAVAQHPKLDGVVASSELGFKPSVLVWSTSHNGGWKFRTGRLLRIYLVAPLG